MPQEVIDALNAEITANGAVQTLLRKYPDNYDDFVLAEARGAAIKKQLGQE